MLRAPFVLGITGLVDTGLKEAPMKCGKWVMTIKRDTKDFVLMAPVEPIHPVDAIDVIQAVEDDPRFTVVGNVPGIGLIARKVKEKS